MENKISFYHLVLFLVSLPFDRIYSELVLISLLLHTLIFLRPSMLKFPDASVFILQSVFYVTLFSSFYSVSPDESLEAIGKQLGIFIFPLLFFYSRLNLRNYRPVLLCALSVCCVLVIIYLYADAIRVIRYNHISYLSLISWEFVNQNFSLPIQMHATYLSMLVVLSLVYTAKQIRNSYGKARMICLAAALVLIAGLIQLGSKSAGLAFVIILLTGIPWLLMKGRTRSRYYLCSFVILGLMLFFMMSFRVFRYRYFLSLKDDLYENGMIAEANGRHDRWNVAADLIRQAPLFGSGSGSEIGLLRESYYGRKMYASYLASLNAHNQYLSFLINSGITGLFIYLFTLGWGLYQSLRHRDLFLLSFMILVMVVSVSEDLLSVNKGIFIYAFFFSFLVITSNRARSDDLEQTATPGP